MSLFTSATAQSIQPKARVSEVTDTYFGQSVGDPYRYMEDIKAKDTAEWIKAQADYARAYLYHLPMRNQILRELNGLSEAGVTVSDIRVRGNLFFYTKPG